MCSYGPLLKSIPSLLVVIVQHFKSLELFTPVAKRVKSMDLGVAASAVVLRYIQVQENYYPQVRHLCVSSDGLRAVSGNVNFLCYNGQPAAADGTEQFRAAWDLKVTAC